MGGAAAGGARARSGRAAGAGPGAAARWQLRLLLRRPGGATRLAVTCSFMPVVVRKELALRPNCGGGERGWWWLRQRQGSGLNAGAGARGLPGQQALAGGLEVFVGALSPTLTA
jgi:hypothetical protein